MEFSESQESVGPWNQHAGFMQSCHHDGHMINQWGQQTIKLIMKRAANLEMLVRLDLIDYSSLSLNRQADLDLTPPHTRSELTGGISIISLIALRVASPGWSNADSPETGSGQLPASAAPQQVVKVHCCGATRRAPTEKLEQRARCHAKIHLLAAAGLLKLTHFFCFWWVSPKKQVKKRPAGRWMRCLAGDAS